jgi:microcin C transport system ATP-binding protein
MANYILVMHRGKVVEEGPAEAIFERPREAYTQALMAASLALEAVPEGSGSEDGVPRQR